MKLIQAVILPPKLSATSSIQGSDLKRVQVVFINLLFTLFCGISAFGTYGSLSLATSVGMTVGGFDPQVNVVLTIGMLVLQLVAIIGAVLFMHRIRKGGRHDAV